METLRPAQQEESTAVCLCFSLMNFSIFILPSRATISYQILRHDYLKTKQGNSKRGQTRAREAINAACGMYSAALKTKTKQKTEYLHFFNLFFVFFLETKYEKLNLKRVFGKSRKSDMVSVYLRGSAGEHVGRRHLWRLLPMWPL